MTTMYCFLKEYLLEDHVLFEEREPEDHVLLDGVHPVLELCPGGVHLGDHGADVADNGGEDEDTHQEIKGDEQVLCVVDGHWGFP
jgi:hypothetical protein